VIIDKRRVLLVREEEFSASMRSAPLVVARKRIVYLILCLQDI